MGYRLLDTFRGLFNGQAYLHRKSNLGDFVAMQLYEDLYELGRSANYTARVDAGISVLNTQNRRRGIKARRGDGSFGEAVPNSNSVWDQGYAVARGAIATIEIGIEVKIMMKAMIKQIDRVMNDLKRQAEAFGARGGNPACVGIVGINRAVHTTTYEGDRPFRTDGKKYVHPIDEADVAEERLLQEVAPVFDEFLVLRFEAVNEAPFGFSWTDESATRLDYGAALVRLSHQYETSF